MDNVPAKCLQLNDCDISVCSLPDLLEMFKHELLAVIVSEE